LQYAIDVLRVKHVLVVGHYGCGGVQAALQNRRLGLIDNWLRHVQDVAQKHVGVFELAPAERHWDLLCELNVIEQVVNVAQTTVVQQAWMRGDRVTIHGAIYGLKDGLLRNLDVSVDQPDALLSAHRGALAALVAKS
jgi:carbonic anhydrase